MSAMIYLDHAATSFPKPPGVAAAVQEWFTEFGVSADRGAGSRTAAVAERVAKVRAELASMCGVPPHRLIFTAGATDGLNQFLRGFLRPGDACLTTELEHSSLVRPLHHLHRDPAIKVSALPADRNGIVSPGSFAAALASYPYRLVAFSHASNAFGTVQDAAEICRIARGSQVVTLLDASATAGLLDLDVGADVLVGSAHKSLLGPPGLGFLAVSERVELPPTRFGGTGSSVALATQPTDWPTAMESGTPNTPAIFGLGAALAFLATQDRQALLAGELERIDQLRRALAGRAILYGTARHPRIPVLSFNIEGFDPAEIGLMLDAAGIHVRTGFHCAPLAFAGQPEAAAGTVRVSVGPFNTAADIDALVAALPLP